MTRSVKDRFDRLAGRIDTLYDLTYSTLDVAFGLVDYVYEHARKRALGREAPVAIAMDNTSVDKDNHLSMLVDIVAYKVKTNSPNRGIWEQMLQKGVYDPKHVQIIWNDIQNKKKNT